MEPTTRAIHPDELLAQMGWVRELARGLVADPGLADDLVQEAWLAASTRPPARIEGPAALRAWLAAVVRNLARQSGRSSARRARREAAAARPEALESTADVVARGALHSELAGAVMQLAEPYRSAVLLRYLDGLAALEVARRQRVSHDAARKRISRGLALLRERLDAAHGGDREAWVLALTAFVERGAPASLGAATSTALLPGALALIVKTILVATCAASALLAAWMLRPGAGEAPALAGRTAAESARAAPSAALVADAAARDRSDLSAVADRELVIVDERGAPREDILALLLEQGSLVASVRSDATGRVRIPAAGEPDQVVLARRGFAPTRVELESGAASQRLVLAGGARVSGHVELPAGAGGLALVLESDRAHAGLESLEGQALDALRGEGIGRRTLSLRVERSGAFAFDGLEPSWTGAVELSEGWTFAGAPPRGDLDDWRSLLLLAPVEELRLEVRPPLAVTGRVVALEDGMPVRGALVIAEPVPTGRSVRAAVEVRTDEQGRFTFGLARPVENVERWSLRLLVEAPGRPLAEVSRPGWDDLAPAGELGDVFVRLGRDVEVHVRDSAGRPVVGAEVGAPRGDSGSAGAPTDAAGRTLMRGLSPAADELLVTAEGYRPRTTPIPAGATELDVILEPTNVLVVSVVDAVGAPVAGLLLRVRAEHLPFATPAEGGLRIGMARRLPFDQLFELDSIGHVALSDLEPGLPLQLSVLDALGGEAAQRQVVAPAALGRGGVELVLDAGSFTISGRAVDARGRALPRVQVYVERDSHTLRARTDADGSFVLGPLLASAAGSHLEATRPGFLPVVLDGLELDPQAEPLELVLERGRSLDVFLTDAEGRAVQLPYLVATFEERASALSDELEPGHHRFDLLPQAAGELQAVLGGVTFRLPIGANESSARFALPPTGRLEVSVDTTELPIGERTCVVLQALDREGEVDRTYFRSGPDGLLPRTLCLPAGRYRVQLESRRLGGPGGSRVTPLGAPLEVVVQAGQELSLTLP